MWFDPLTPTIQSSYTYGALAGGGFAAAYPFRGNSGFRKNWITLEPEQQGTSVLINNRQVGRRRGRGGQQPRNNNGGGRDNGNRIDNRARGNAPQMLEKYKTLASDAQRQGDRVMTEYYLQFADHYFRVVAETRARFEESRPNRQDWQGDDGDQGEGDSEERGQSETGDYDDEDAVQEREVEQARRQPRPQQRDNRNRTERAERPIRSEQPDQTERFSEDRGNRINRGYGRDVEPVVVADTIDVAVLPPSFGSDGPINPMMDVTPIEIAVAAPKRRARPRKADTIEAAE
jgi:Domain of unknown function (DUF4167)